MKYFLVKGIVASLEVSKTQIDMSFSPKVRDGIALAGIVETIMEVSSSSTLLASSRQSTEIEMEYFRCFVDGKQLAGNFYEIGFVEGDEMEFVVEDVGEYYSVRAACSESKRLIWTLPNQTRGSLAQKRADILGSFLCSAIAAFIFLVIAYFISHETYAQKWVDMQRFFFMGFILVFLVNAITRFTLYGFSKEATKIFKVLGFFDPEEVDLLKNHKAAETQYRIDTKNEAAYHPAWQFRYETYQKSTLDKSK